MALIHIRKGWLPKEMKINVYCRKLGNFMLNEMRVIYFLVLLPVRHLNHRWMFPPRTVIPHLTEAWECSKSFGDQSVLQRIRLAYGLSRAH